MRVTYFHGNGTRRAKRTGVLPALCTVLLSALVACGAGESVDVDATSVNGVQVRGAVIREALPGVPDGVLYLTLQNTGDEPVELLGGETPLAQDLVPMKAHTVEGHDHPLDLTLDPGETLEFTPGADHLMLVGLTRPPQVGETVEVTLHLRPGGNVTFEVPVEPY